MVTPIGAATAQPVNTTATTAVEPKKAEDSKETTETGSKAEKALSLIQAFESSFEQPSDQTILQRANDPNPLPFGSGNYMPFGAESYGFGGNNIIPKSLMGNASNNNMSVALNDLSEAFSKYCEWASERYGKPDSEGGGEEAAA